ncbi:MAG TPA: LytR C-terminal domain-containing protein [Candidatus Methylomirabilis sp.]|nr:LytR C-terminal domain-containing protein [Candidatus Methylomirabilis sp.]
MIRKPSALTSKKSAPTVTPSAARGAPASTQRFFGRPIVVLVIVAGMAVTAAYLWITQPKQVAIPTAGATAETSPEIKKEVESIIDRVARHMVVNLNEQPYVANISDIESVRQANPAFYKDAEEGDKVLIWSDKAIIYSPTKDRIVAVVASLAPPSVSPSSAATTTAATLENVTIEVRNGSGKAGEASRMRTKLKDAGLTVSRVGDAVSRPDATIVIDLTNGQSPNALAKALEITGGSAGPVPEHEPATNANILVIIGKSSVQ